MSSSVLPWKWVIEFLADVPDVGTSILSALVDRFPDLLADSSGVVRERVALRYLEEFSGMACGETPPVVAANAPSTSASATKIDASKTCEEVLRSKVAAANDDLKGEASFDDGDIHQFILLKRGTLPKTNIDLLKEKILGSYHPDISYSKERDDLARVSGPVRVNCLTSNHHRDHDGIKSIMRTMTSTNSRLKKLTIIRKYRELKNLRDNPPLKPVVGASQKISSSQQHFPKQKVPDDEMRNQQTKVDDTTEKTKTNTCEPQRDNLSGYVPAPTHDSPNKFKESLRSEQLSRKQNILHDDGADSQEGADGLCDDVLLLEQQSSMLQSSPSQNLCMKCSLSGQLLNCRGDGCSRSIHEGCLGLSASVEESGLFCCPFCAYRNARILYEKSKKKAQEARRNLFFFYDINPMVNALKRKNSSEKFTTRNDEASIDHHSSEHPDLPSNLQLQNGSDAQTHNDTQNLETSNIKFVRDNNLEFTQNQQNQLNNADDIVCKVILPCRETIECHIDQVVQDTPIKLKSDSGREQECAKVTENQKPVDDHGINGNGVGCVTSSRNEAFEDHSEVEEIKNMHTGDADREQISLQASKGSPLRVEDECDHDAKRKALASQIGGRFAKRKRREEDVKVDNYEGAVANQRSGSSSSRELRKNTHRQNRCFTPKLIPSRRTKLIWKPEEEEILAEAMQKIPKNEDGSIPWTKILEYGRRLLHESRNPIDLKDKWRNMRKKEAKKRI